jgi:F-type H+-transporting ATPase subunit c
MTKMISKLNSLCAFGAVFMTAALAHAQDAATKAPLNGYACMAIAIGIGIAALGGALGQSRAAAAALEGIARNPNASDKVFVPMILGLAFIESLVLFTWVLMFMMLGKM